MVGAAPRGGGGGAPGRGRNGVPVRRVGPATGRRPRPRACWRIDGLASAGGSGRTQGRSARGQTLQLIHRSAWKGNSANFVFWVFSEVRIQGGITKGCGDREPKIRRC